MMKTLIDTPETSDEFNDSHYNQNWDGQCIDNHAILILNVIASLLWGCKNTCEYLVLPCDDHFGNFYSQF